MKNSRFKNWKKPRFNKNGITKWQWMCQYHQNLKILKNSDIGAFSYINAKFGVIIEENVQIGSHCSIYSESTIDGKTGPIVIGKNARVGSHTTVMPGVTIGENAIVGAHSFVTSDVQPNSIVFGVPAKEKNLKKKK